jgi:hypothetical protein
LCSPSTILSDALRRAEERADALAAKLELSEKAHEKAEADAAIVESLRQRLQTAENAFSDKIAQQIERENAIADRFDTQNQRFVSKLFSFTCLYVYLDLPLQIFMDPFFVPARRMGEEFTLHEEVEDRLLDTLSIL